MGPKKPKESFFYCYGSFNQIGLNLIKFGARYENWGRVAKNSGKPM